MNGSGGNNHPVWDVYNEYRTARLNVRCYEMLLSWLERKNKWMEIVILFSTSSAAAGLWIFANPTGAYVWKSISAFAAILAIIKPILKYPDAIKVTSEMLSDYRALDNSFQKLVISIKQRGQYDDEFKNRFQELLDKKAKIIDKYIVGPIASSYKILATDVVNEELPPESFYIPEV